MTAEIFRRIDQLYTAAKDMAKRAEKHYSAENFVQGRRAVTAGDRLNHRAFMLMFSQLPRTEKTRYVERICTENQKVNS